MKKLLSPKDIENMGIRLSKAQRWRLAKEGKFPKPIKLGTHTSAWDADEIAAWLEARKAAR